MLKQLFNYFIGVIIVLSTTCCGGCQDNGNGTGPEPKTEPKTTLNTEEKLTQNGFKYVHHIQNNGRKPQVGEYAYYELELYGVTDSTARVFFIEAGSHSNKILSLEQTKGFTSPIVDVLHLMSIGDSVTVIQMPESVGNLPPEYQDVAQFNFNIKLTAIKSPADHSNAEIAKFNKRKANLKEARANLETILASCQKVLKDYKGDNLKTNLIQSKSGLKYMIKEEGEGKILRNGNIVNFFYCGLLMDGTIIENTFESGFGTSIQVGRAQSLPGWDEAMTYLKYGTKVFLFVPYHLAYGEDGNPPNVPPKSEVMFYMELME
jgi:FKBP-type peptidyl-prolyl cis-trans isomerase